MAREFRSFLLITAEKTSSRRGSELFQKYVNALARSPRQLFRMRDADALARFTIAAALACNDYDDFWFTEAQLEVLAEIGVTLYDAVAFRKHRAEAEINSTFAYMPPRERIKAYERCRALLWDLDAAFLSVPQFQVVFNFMRYFGGPIHMTMHRCRFVEEGLTIGKPEDSQVIEQTRRNVKLWLRKGEDSGLTQDAQRYREIQERSQELLFPGLAYILDHCKDVACVQCRLVHSDSVRNDHVFSGVRLCNGCEVSWRDYLTSLPHCLENVFPEINSGKMKRVDSATKLPSDP